MLLATREGVAAGSSRRCARPHQPVQKQISRGVAVVRAAWTRAVTASEGFYRRSPGGTLALSEVLAQPLAALLKPFWGSLGS
eukprot:1655010-Pyramimonas_sp.AAC.1